MSNYVYWRSEPGLWTVGYIEPDGSKQPESDHDSTELAAKRVRYLNGGSMSIGLTEINWDDVREQIRSGDHSTRDSLRAAQKKLTELYQEKYQEDQQRERQAKLKALKELKRGQPLWYTGTDLRFLGKELMKSADGREYMTVAFEGKLWKMPYSQLQTFEPTSSDVAVKRGGSLKLSADSNGSDNK